MEIALEIALNTRLTSLHRQLRDSLTDKKSCASFTLKTYVPQICWKLKVRKSRFIFNIVLFSALGGRYTKPLPLTNWLLYYLRPTHNIVAR